MIKAEMEKKEGKEIKAIIIDVLQNTDPAELPSNAPPVGMVKAMPASILRLMAEKLGMDFEIADIDLGESAAPRYLEDNTLAIPETMQNVIVLAFEMDYDSIESAPTIQGDIATILASRNFAKFVKSVPNCAPRRRFPLTVKPWKPAPSAQTRV